jgi:hypothetical protein
MNSRIEHIVSCASEPVEPDVAAIERVAAAVRASAAPRRLPAQARRGLVYTLFVALFSFAAGGVTVGLLSRSQDVRAPAEAATAVTFVLVADRAKQVSLVGDFNDWVPGATTLRRRPGGVWSVVVPLVPGRYSYAFVLDDGTWLVDPTAPLAAEEDFGHRKSVVIVENAEL